jgi:hypothetical protein
MGDYEAYTVSKENVEDDRALLTSGVIGTGTAVEKQPILDRYTVHTKYIHIKSTTVYVPSSELGLSHLLSRQRVFPSPQNLLLLQLFISPNRRAYIFKSFFLYTTTTLHDSG